MCRCVLLALVGMSVVAFPAMAEKDSIEALQRRIQELETQNRAMLEELAKIKSALAGTTAVAPDIAADGHPKAVQTKSGDSRLSFYGFARMDAIYDDSRPNAQQTPTFILSEDPSTGNDDDSSFTFHPRLTRIGMDFNGPVLQTLGDAQISGKVEFDFQNGGRESRALPRYRHAYFNLDWGDSSLLVGQTSDIISPLYPTVNGDTLQWNAGNLGDRRMQVRYSRKNGGPFSVAVGAGLTGAINSQDLDADGVRDGEDSALPHLQARLGYGGERIKWGLWGHYGREETRALFNGQNEFDSHSLGVDFDVSLSSLLRLRGELWTGMGLGDVRGGIGQTVNTTTGEEIDSSGGWLELGVRPTKKYFFSVGLSVDDPEDENVPVGGRTDNRVWYITNQWRPGKPFMFGFDYLNWETDFNGLAKGMDNRVNVHSIYYF